MQIKLKNFKQHKSLQIDLSSKGIVMLQGKTGAGKSSILEAISFALYGQPSKVKSWNGGKCEVSLEIAGAKVVRTAGPSSLAVEIDGKTFLDAEAQQVINQKVLLMQESEFAISSYIQQGAENSLLSLTPAEMQKTIQSVAYKGVDPDDIKKSLAKKALDQNTIVAKLQSRLEAQKEYYEASARSFSESALPEEKQKPDILPEDARKILEAERQKSYQIQSQIDDVNKKISEGSENIISHNESKINSTQKIVHAVDEKILKVRSDMDNNTPWKSVSKEGVKERSLIYQQKIEMFNIENKIADILNNIMSLAGLSKESDTKSHEEYIKTSTQKLDDLRSEAVSLKEQIKDLENWEDTVKCPSCQADLKIMQKKLVESKAKPDDIDEQIASLKEKLDVIIERGKNLSARIDSVKKLCGQYEGAKAQYDEMTDPMPDVDDFYALQAEVEHNNKYILEQEQKEKEFSSLKEEMANLENSRMFYVSEINSLKEANEKLSGQRSDENLPLKREKLEQEMADCREAMKALEMQVVTSISQLSVYERYLDAKRDFLEKKEKLLALKKDLENTAKDLKEAEEKAAACEVAKKIHQKASSAALEQKINEINSLSKRYVDRLFEDDGTVIALSSVVETQKKEIRSKIGVNIAHKGNKVKSIKELSGGERARACLAFQLGLSDLYHSPFLMIDEGFNGLDLQTKEECLEVLREVSEDKLLMVVEHGAPEAFFDDVIKIN